MVATSFERVPRRRAQCRGVEIVIGDTRGGKIIECRRRNRTAYGAGAAKANVIDQDDYHIGSFLGCRDVEKRRCFHITNI